MRVYLDSTYVLRQLLGAGEGWQLWGKWEKAYASALLRAECSRAANALKQEGKLDDGQRARLGSWIETVCACVTTVPVSDAVLQRAAEPFPVDVGTLQSLHLATLLELRAAGVTCKVATDDAGLLRAAQSLGFEDAFAAEAAKPAEEKPVETAAPAANAAESAS